MGLFRTDNDNREARVHELTTDINSLIVGQGEIANSIGDRIAAINALEKENNLNDYSNYQKIESQQEIDLLKKVWTFGKITTAISLDVALSKYFMKAAAMKVLTSSGAAVTEQSLAAAVTGLSRSAKFLSITKGTVITVAFTFGVEAINDEIVYHQLKDATQNLRQTRFEQKKTERTLRQVDDVLHELVTQLEVFKNTSLFKDTNVFTQEKVREIVQSTIDNAKHQIKVRSERITDDLIWSELANFDHARKSWDSEG